MNARMASAFNLGENIWTLFYKQNRNKPTYFN